MIMVSFILVACISNVTSLSLDNSEFYMAVNSGKDPDDSVSPTYLESHGAFTSYGLQGRRKISNWFTFINFRSILYQNTPETGNWFLSNSEFQAWLSKDSGLLCSID